MPQSLFSPIPLSPVFQPGVTLRRIALRYSLAVALAFAVFLVRMAFQPLLGEAAPFALCHPAILTAAFFGGWGPGLLTLAISAISADYFFLSPHHSLSLGDSTSQLRMGLFLLSGLIIAVMGGSLQQARRRAAFDTAQLELQAGRFRESEERYRRMFETAYEGIWCLDANNQTSYVNGRMVAMVGYSIIGMVGHQATDFVFAEDKSRLETILARRRSGGKEVFDFRFRRKDGTPVWCTVSTQSIFGKDGQFDGSLHMVTDITARRLTTEDLNQTLDSIRLDVQAIHDLQGALVERIDSIAAGVPADAPQHASLVAVRASAVQAAELGERIIQSLRSRKAGGTSADGSAPRSKRQNA